MQRIVILLFLSVICLFGTAQAPYIVRAEYYFDIDPGLGNGIALSFSPDTNVTIIDIIDINGLTEGYHSLFVRAQDEYGEVSLTFRRPLLVIESLPYPNITELEYFFDVDPGYGLGFVQYPDTIPYFDTNIVIDISGLDPGIHTIYIRAKDDYDNWSQTFTRKVLVLGISNPRITEMEYYFDNDPGYGLGTKINFDSTANLDTNIVIDISGLNNGTHTMYVRGKDDLDNWSLTNFWQFSAITLTPEPDITYIEYFFDSDPGLGNGTSIPFTPDSILTISTIIDITGLSEGFHSLYIRARDENGIYSHTLTRPFLVIETQAGIPKIIELEYFVDVDPGYGNGFIIALDSTELLDTSILIPLDSADNNTTHNLFIRAKDEKGNYSLTNMIEFLYREIIDQEIVLSAGWNIISFYVEPSDTTMMAVVQPLIDDSVLVKMQDEGGNAIEKIGASWVNNIGVVMSTEGYKINVNKDTSLIVDGRQVILPQTIDLEAGWNIMGFPSDQNQITEEVLFDLVDYNRFSKLQDESGLAYEYIQPLGWVNNIPTLEPGEGYKIKVNWDSEIEINYSFLKSKAVSANIDDGIYYFKPSWIGNGLDHMNIYIASATINGKPIDFGDELAVFDGGTCVGICKIVDITKDYVALSATYDDNGTKIKDGFENGNHITFKIWDASENIEYSEVKSEFLKGYSNIYDAHGTTIASIEAVSSTTQVDQNIKFETKLGLNYPNPFTDNTTIEFTLAKQEVVIIDIYDAMGSKVKSLTNSVFNAGYHTISWDLTNDNMEKLSAGIYFYEMKTGDELFIKRMIAVE
ncbi:T9SS type A sorting domain-containing protein [Bacteroidota bacterium]